MRKVCDMTGLLVMTIYLAFAEAAFVCSCSDDSNATKPSTTMNTPQKSRPMDVDVASMEPRDLDAMRQRILYHRDQPLLWIHVPKNGGTILAFMAHAAAAYHNGSIAWCYGGGGDRMSCPELALGQQRSLQKHWFGPYNPAATGNHITRPRMVYGHRVFYGAAEAWGYPKERARYVVMVRHPLERLLSAFGQAIRHPNPGDVPITLPQFINTCATNGHVPNGALEEFLSGDNQGPDFSRGAQVHLAMRALRDDRVIVLMHDDMETSLLLLDRLGVIPTAVQRSSVEGIAKANAAPVTSKPLNVSYADITAIRKCISFEEELYYEARASFRRLCAAVGLKPSFDM